MALYHSSTARRRRFAGPAKPWAIVFAFGAAGLLAGCGADPDPASTAISQTAVTQGGVSPAAPLPIDVVSTAASQPPAPGADTVVPVVSGKVRYGIPATAELGAGASLNGAVPFPRTDPWNREVSQAAVDAASDTIVAAIGADAPLRPGFGVGTGIPYVVVAGSQPRATVRLAGSPAARSWPIPSDAPLSAAQARVIVVDRDAGHLYELFDARLAADGSWDAAGGAVRRLDLADATPADGLLDIAGIDTGTSVFPGLVRRDEAAAGVIRHALRITAPQLRSAWLAPAQRAPASAAGGLDIRLPPAGLRLRLKASFEIPATASAPARAILQALKTYGAIVVAEGPAWALDGAPDAGWDIASLAPELARARGADFEVIATQAPAAP